MRNLKIDTNGAVISDAVLEHARNWIGVPTCDMVEMLRIRGNSKQMNTFSMACPHYAGVPVFIDDAMPETVIQICNSSAEAMVTIINVGDWNDPSVGAVKAI